jgi:hypothetical protein
VTGSYQSLFIAASMIYLVALLIMHLLNPRLEPMKLAVGDSPHSLPNA